MRSPCVEMNRRWISGKFPVTIWLMPALDFDAIIIGGGPAGSTTGAYLSRAGLRVLIVEKARFPRFHIGESIMPVANGILQETGAWERVERAGFVPKHGAEFHVGNKSVLPRHVEFAKGLLPGVDYTFQVERAKFDHLLLDHAAESGCEVRQETKASGVRAAGDDGYEVVLQTAGRDGTTGEETVRGAFLIDASGRSALFAQPTPHAPGNPDLAKRVAIYSHFGNVPRAAGKAGGNIVIVRNADGWAWLIPLAGDRLSVGVVVTTAAMRAAKLKPEALFWKVVGESPKLAQTLANAKGEGAFHVEADYHYRARKFAAPRMLRVGDAACFLDPMFSTGVFLALLSAKLAAREILQAHRAGRALNWRDPRRQFPGGRSRRPALERALAVLAVLAGVPVAAGLDRGAEGEPGGGDREATGGRGGGRFDGECRSRDAGSLCRIERRSIDPTAGMIALLEMASFAAAGRKVWLRLSRRLGFRLVALASG